MRVILLRHAESEANVAGDNSDHPETKLSKLGKEQAKKAAEYLAHLNKIGSLNIKYILSSPFARAMDTAAPIAAKLKLDIIPHVELREGSNGIIDGVKFADIKHLTRIVKKKNAAGKLVEKVEPVGQKLQKIDDALTKMHKEKMPKFDPRYVSQIAKFERIAGGESGEQIYKRANKVINKYTDGTGDVLVVSHGGTIKEYIANTFKINSSNIGTNFLIQNGKEIKNCHLSVINMKTGILEMMQDNRWLV